MKTLLKSTLLAIMGVGFPFISQAQGLADEMSSLHGVLEQLYDEMMPLCSQLIGVAQAIAGFAATWYIASRIWRHIANAEPIDFYPLFRPFVLGFCIMIFPSVLAMINGVLKPTVTATASMVKGSNKAISVLLKQKENAIKNSDVWQMYVGESGSGDRDKWYKYTHDNQDPSQEGVFEGIGNDIKFAMSKFSYNLRNSVKEWMSEILSVLFEAAALCIDTLRTFQLVVMAILGPLVFGLAVFDGLQHTLTAWLARYINIFLWLPVANIFGSIIGKVQEKMIEADISQVESYGDTFFNRTDVAYLVFMIIGIIGYFTVPSVANYIVNAGGGGLAQKVTNTFSSTTNSTVSTAGSIVSATGRAAGSVIKSGFSHVSGHSNQKSSSSSSNDYMSDKLSGNSK